MKKVLIILCLVSVMVVPADADTSLPISLTKPLCSFPFGLYAGNAGGFFVQYDGRFYDASYAGQTSLPNGGIKFAVELGYYEKASDRDTAANQVINITYINTTIGQTHILTQPGKYFFTDVNGVHSYVADYTLWLGQASNAIGEWKIHLVHKSGIYTANFSITEAMIDSLAPIPVEVEEITKINDSFFELKFDPTPFASQYRVRILDGINFLADFKISPPFSNPISVQIPSIYAGKSGRVEARLTSSWIGLIHPCGAIPNQFTTQSSRACTFFNLAE